MTFGKRAARGGFQEGHGRHLLCGELVQNCDFYSFAETICQSGIEMFRGDFAFKNVNVEKFCHNVACGVVARRAGVAR